MLNLKIWKCGCFDWVPQIFKTSRNEDNDGTPLVSYSNDNYSPTFGDSRTVQTGVDEWISASPPQSSTASVNPSNDVLTSNPVDSGKVAFHFGKNGAEKRENLSLDQYVYRLKETD